jgi:hypothetical protein
MQTQQYDVIGASGMLAGMIISGPFNSREEAMEYADTLPGGVSFYYVVAV